MKKINIIIVVLLSIFCVACGSQPCPDVSVALDYFPYYKGQELKFTNSQNNTLAFIIANKENENAGSARRGGIGYKGNYCPSYAGFGMSTTQDTIKINCNISVDGSLDKVWSTSLSIHFYAGVHNSSFFNEALKKTCSYKNLSKNLEDTIVIENENNQIVKKIVIVKGKGLISYTTADGEEWKLIE